MSAQVAEVAFINRLSEEGKEFDMVQRRAEDARRLDDIREQRRRQTEARQAQTAAVEVRYAH